MKSYLVCQSCDRNHSTDSCIDPVESDEVRLIYPHIASLVQASQFWVIESHRHGVHYRHNGEPKLADADLVNWLVRHYLHGGIMMHGYAYQPAQIIKTIPLQVFTPDDSSIHANLLSKLTNIRDELTNLITAKESR